MTAPPPRIRIVIDTLRLRGLPSRDARRLLDTVERELIRLAPEITLAAGLPRDTTPITLVKSPPIPAPRRIEAAGAPIAQAILKAIAP